MLGHMQQPQQQQWLDFMQLEYIFSIDQQFKMLPLRCQKFLQASIVKTRMNNDYKTSAIWALFKWG
jgi:hypothetical protein